MNREQVDKLAATCGWSSEFQAAVAGTGTEQRQSTGGASQCHDFKMPEISLVFVGWAPSEIDPREPRELSTVASFLSQLAHLHKFDMANIGIWRPEVEELQGLEVGIRLGDCKAIRELMLESLDNSTFQMAGYADALEDEPKDFLAARADLARALAEANDGLVNPERVDDAFGKFTAVVDEWFFEPSVTRALASADPAARGLSLVAAELSRELILQAPSVQGTLGNMAKGEIREDADLRGKRFIDGYLRFVDSLIKTYREAKR